MNRHDSAYKQLFQHPEMALVCSTRISSPPNGSGPNSGCPRYCLLSSILENSREPEDLVAVVGRLVEWLNDPTQESLRRSFVAWLKRIGLKRRVSGVEIDEVDGLQEMHAMLAERIEARHERWEKQGMEKGWSLGEAHVLRRQLARRFGESLPDWVEERLAGASR